MIAATPPAHGARTRRCAIWARVSSPKQDTDETTSLDAQVASCRTRAAELGYTVVEEYVVRDVSSGSVDSTDRVQLQRLLTAADVGAFDAVISAYIDRTSRGGIFEFADICGRFLRAGVTPIWAEEDIDLTTPTGQLIAAAKAWGAAQEREAIVRRFRQGKQSRISQGKLGRAYISFGYRWDETRTQYEPDPVTAPIVQHIYRTLAQGGSAKAIRDELNRTGVPTPSQLKGVKRTAAVFKGRPATWSVPVLTYLVRNPVYKGERIQNRYQSEPRDRADRRQRGLRTAQRVVERDPSAWTITPVPPLVDAETWAAADAQLRRNAFVASKPTTRYTAAEVLLSGGYVRCALCGRAVHIKRRTDRRVQTWYYRCAQNKPQPDGGHCPGMAIETRAVDTRVWEEAVRLIRDPQYLRAVLTVGDTEVWSPQQQLDHYTGLLRTLDAEDAAITSELLRLAGKPGLDHIRANLEAEATRHAELRTGYQERLADAQQSLATQQQRTDRVQRFATWAADHRDHLDDLTADERRHILRTVMHPTVFVSRAADTTRPRIAIIFSVTPEAAARLDPATLYSTIQGRDRSGVYTVYVDDAGNITDAGGGATLDLSTVPSVDLGSEKWSIP